VSIARVVLDTNVFLAARTPDEPGHAAALRLLDAVDRGGVRALVSVISLAELRAGFTAAQVPALWTPFLSHLRASPSYSVEPVDEAIAVTAGELRSSLGLTLPDALILSTAKTRMVDCLVTEDRELLRSKSGIATKRASEVRSEAQSV
jgi:predicted nucleic acid-binding protein